MKTKLFREEYDTNIDDLINEWLDENDDVQVKDIKLTNCDENLSALVVYEE